MGEKEILEISSNTAIMLAECRVRCIVDNAKCIVKASLQILMPLHKLFFFSLILFYNPEMPT